MKERANTKYIKVNQESQKQTLLHQTDAMDFLAHCFAQGNDLHGSEIL